MKGIVQKFKGWLPQYRSNMTLALPVVLSQVGQVVVQLIDNAMVGQLGATPLAAVSFGGAIFTLFMLWGMGLSLGLTPLVGEQYTKGDHRVMSYLFQNSMVLFMAGGVAIFGALLLIGLWMPYMGQDPAVVAQALPYYHFLAWSILPYMLFVAFKQFLEGIGNTTTGMVVVLSANTINVFFNYLFIYGHWGAPEMGAAGAGLATLISRICMPLFMLVYFLRHDSTRRYLQFFARVHQSWLWTRELLRVGLPISIQVVLEMSAFSLTLIMMGWIGVTQLAAHQIVISLSSFVFMIVMGISSATTILVSHELGSNNLSGLRRAASASYHLGLVTNILTMAVFIIFRHWIPRLFTSDEAVIEVAGQLMIMAGLFQVADGLQVISLGILRGLQDVRITMIYAFMAYIVINLPLGYLCAFTFGMGAPGLWVGFIVGLSVAAILLYRRYARWMRIHQVEQR